ncbi:MAG TPA: alcohol dehydrogenase [Cyanobacteria bacterium UBA8530]|nr:alcohol dehydrogenase [Cyanobacteria bacterium UBA8530]
MEKENLGALRKFVVPEFVFGWGARTLLSQYAKNFAFRHPLLVSDAGVMEAGWAEDAASRLRVTNVPFSLFSRLSPNPRDHEVMEGAEFFDKEGCDSLVVVGGGSAIDTAKGIGIIISNGGHILDYEGVDKIPLPIPPLLCIPTTGSSADVSQFAIILNGAEKRKISIISKAIVPDVSLIDPETSSTMDPLLTAYTGMDVLSHAFESLVSNASSPITDLLALEAIRLLIKHLPPESGLSDVSSRERRSAMMLSSLQAGMAFSNASLGLIHAMSHSLGGLTDTPHGECHAILLEPVIAYNYEAAPRQYELIGEAMGLALGENPKETLLSFIGELKQRMGLKKRLSDLGIIRSDIPRLALGALMDPCLVTNPRQPTLLDVESLYERAL